MLLTAGAAEAFVLLARALQPRHAVVVHPQFTEPEAALRAAGHQVDQVILPFPFTLDPALVPADADLVFIGNPTNPTSIAHPRDVLLQLVRPGRIVVVDEAFADCLPGEPESVAGNGDLDGLVVIRSLTKTWALAGLRVGYLLAAPEIVRAAGGGAAAVAGLLARAGGVRRHRRPMPPPARSSLVRGLAVERAHLLAGSRASAGCEWWRPRRRRSCCSTPGSPTCGPDCTRDGFAVRRGETFPGLGPGWIRVAVRDAETSDRFSAALREVIADGPSGNPGTATTGTAPPGPAAEPACRRRCLPRPASARPDVASSCSAAAGRGSPGMPSSCSRMRRR